jgi:hypothetical protein
MSEINEDILARVYNEYSEALHTRAKIGVLVSAVKEILVKLNRYVEDQEKFNERSDVALQELEQDLNRFYFYDKEFIDRLMYEARAYIIEHQETVK